MNMYKASFETEQNYPYKYNTTKNNPYKNSVYYNNFFKYIQKKNENTFFTKKNLFIYYIIS